METSQLKYDIYERLLSDIDYVCMYIKKTDIAVTNDSIIKGLREFIYYDMGLQWDIICAIIDKHIESDHTDPLRIYFNKELYNESSDPSKVH